MPSLLLSGWKTIKNQQEDLLFHRFHAPRLFFLHISFALHPIKPLQFFLKGVIMKNILALTGLVLSLNAYADSSCSFQLTNRNFGPIAVMKIQNAEVVQELKEKFPY